MIALFWRGDPPWHPEPRIDKKAYDTYIPQAIRAGFDGYADPELLYVGAIRRLRYPDLNKATKPASASVCLLLLLVPVLAQALLALVRGNLVTFPFFTARHELDRWL